MPRSLTLSERETRYIEPARFHYGILLQSEEHGDREMLKEILARPGLSEIPVQTNRYTISARSDEYNDLIVCEVKGRKNLESLVSALRKLEEVLSGIISTSADNIESHEHDLVRELVEKAMKKAGSYAAMIKGEMKGISSLEISDVRKQPWFALPPYQNLTKQELFTAIIQESRNKDMIEIAKEVRITFEIE